MTFCLYHYASETCIRDFSRILCDKQVLKRWKPLGVSTEEFMKFKKAREIYARGFEAKNKNVGINIAATSFCDSVDELVLGLMVSAKRSESLDINTVTENQIWECVRLRSSIITARYDRSENERDIQGLKLSDSTPIRTWKQGLKSYTFAIT